MKTSGRFKTRQMSPAHAFIHRNLSRIEAFEGDHPGTAEVSTVHATLGQDPVTKEYHFDVEWALSGSYG